MDRAAAGIDAVRYPEPQAVARKHLSSNQARAIESAPKDSSVADSSEASVPRPSALAALEARVATLEQELAKLKQTLGVA